MPRLSKVPNQVLLAIVLIACSAIGCASNSKREFEAFCSMVALLSVPDRYDGKIIQTEGVLQIAFESDQIWLSREHFEEGIIANSIAITPPYKDEEFYARMRNLSGTYVLIEGRFRKGNPREIGTPRGYINEITNVIPLEK